MTASGEIVNHPLEIHIVVPLHVCLHLEESCFKKQVIKVAAAEENAIQCKSGASAFPIRTRRLLCIILSQLSRKEKPTVLMFGFHN